MNLDMVRVLHCLLESISHRILTFIICLLVPKGWDYAKLDVVDSAMSIAQSLYRNFLESLHGNTAHQNPKTIAIADTAGFAAFLQA